MTTTTDSVETPQDLPVGSGFIAEFRKDGSIAIKHELGGLHMATMSEMAMVHRLADLERQLLAAKVEIAEARSKALSDALAMCGDVLRLAPPDDDMDDEDYGNGFADACNQCHARIGALKDKT